tara:strand:- start:58 stop:384 length:327 start_codon:yes stop_codon:yes gene_type:complete
MIWPPLKAWTSKESIRGERHFVAINYGGKLIDRWVILISVVDAGVAIKVPWSQLRDTSKWNCGWDENNFSDSTKIIDDKSVINSCICIHPSQDSGLTIPISQKKIRSW